MKHTFTLNPQLEQDSFYIGDLSLCQVRLMNHADNVWLILIPKIQETTELFELSTEQQQTLMQEITHISQLLKQHFPCDKINVGSLGNVVAQLHIHVIARTKTDRYWPKPVWGNPTIPYAQQARDQVIAELQQTL
jgi:diadenosine tetraphosphate (Ap4A) HIT family hydrolase